MNLAPIALFVYNRLKHTKQTIEALQKNPLSSKSDLFIFSDGAKNISNETEVEEIRSYLKTITGFNTITIIERSKNLGLAQSIITGVTEIVNKYGNIIVLEDDLVTSPFFLDYMNNALEKYKNQSEVVSIHGYVYPIKNELPETFFIKGADCWGWATWKRGWDLFESDGEKLLNELLSKKLSKQFDINDAYPYTQMLKDQIKGSNNSWAIRWHASAFLNNKLTLYPGRSLVQNIGFDNSGTHCGTTEYLNAKLSNTLIQIISLPTKQNEVVLKQFEKYLKKYRKDALVQKIKIIQQMNRSQIAQEIKQQLKKRVSKNIINKTKLLLNNLGFKRIISGDYRIITNPNLVELKNKFENTWQDKSIPKQQIKITKQQINNYQQIPAMKTLVESIKKFNPTGKSILDVGCSTGYFSEIFKKANLNANYTGCDYSQAFINVAKNKYPNETFDVADATNLPYNDNQFDITISGNCLLHIIDYETAIQEVARVAKEFTIFHRTPTLESHKTIYTEKIGYGKKMLEIIFSEKELIQLFLKSNLSVIDIITHDSYSVPSLNEEVQIKNYICKKIQPVI